MHLWLIPILALMVCSCSKTAAGDPVHSADDDTWMLEFRGVTDTEKFGRSISVGRYELDLRDKSNAKATAVSELIEYPKKLGECDIVSSDGYVRTTLTLDVRRDGMTLHMHESWPARTATLELRCMGITTKTPLPLEGGDHEFSIALSEGATADRTPPIVPHRTSNVRYTLRRPTAAELAIRKKASSTTKLCLPTPADQAAIHKAIMADDYNKAIDLARDALGLPSLRAKWNITRDPTMNKEGQYGATSPDGSIKLGTHAFDNSPILLSTMMHEAIGHSLNGTPSTGPDLLMRYAAEEIAAYHMETTAFDKLGVPQFERGEIQKELASRLGGFKHDFPEQFPKLQEQLNAPSPVSWEQCHE